MRRQSAMLVVCSLMLMHLVAACDRTRQPAPSGIQGTVTLVNRVTATVRGFACADCGAALEAALGRGLDPATITIGPKQDLVEVAFEQSASPFSSASFRRAVATLGGEVQSLQIEACGTIEATDQGSWLTSGSTRLLLEGPVPEITGTELCVIGDLRDDASPARLVVRARGS